MYFEVSAAWAIGAVFHHLFELRFETAFDKSASFTLFVSSHIALSHLFVTMWALFFDLGPFSLGFLVPLRYCALGHLICKSGNTLHHILLESDLDEISETFEIFSDFPNLWVSIILF